ncbi:hypothetical protein [Agrococcus sp. HG114]|uniref:hypothetical protein n=1 Tax=Agrococcus sp. HG114 TaxID=2969757 RepID=UPI00215AECDF|nr:hypothetical protein [Agrococcus sp. HG114]MCR8670025.1 hypothetical protein [Agrococcus sp. HG114]
MTDTRASAPRSSIGRSRFGGGGATLIIASLLLGLAVSSAMGGLYAWLGDTGDAWLRFSILAFVTLPVTASLGWVLLVDRSSVKDAVERPEDSVESRWFAKAAEGTMIDAFVVIGIGAAVFSFAEIELPVGLVLVAIDVLLLLDLGIRYLVAKLRSA